MDVIKIAICDDEETAVALHEKIVKTCLQAQGIGCEITTYTQSRNLLCDITDDGFFYDLILLDIEMPGISGMEIPRKIQGFLPNIRIIFVTSHTEYAIGAFELSIFRYVPKNNLEAKLTAAVTDAAKLIELEAGQEYTVRTASRMEKIPYKDIFYIRREGKNASIVSSAGASKVRKSLRQVFEELNAPEFIFIDRGYIVNIVHIMKISDIRSVDLTTILGNLLDNALEAAETAPDELRFLDLTIRRINAMLIIKVENGYGNAPVESGGELETTKKDKSAHGWGLKSVQTAADRCDGTITTDHKDGVFRSVVTLSFQPVKTE